MARSLPLGDLSQAIVPDTPTDGASIPDAIGGTVAVYDPAMCCPTGVCGPGVDPALLQVARDLRWLDARGVTVQRYGLAQEPAAFAQSTRVAGLLQAFGEKALPATLVNGEVLAHGRYPTRDEVIGALAQAPARGRTGPPTDGGCAPGSGCC
jgi:hypothetical protein